MFAKHFPTLARYPADKWMMIPMAFIVTIGVLMGVVEEIFTVQKQCNPCHDTQMKALDEYLCTGRVGSTGSFDRHLAACRRKLGKPEAY